MTVKRILRFFIYFLVILLLAQGCATKASLSGGPRDTEPPALDTLKSTKNFQTHFKKQKIKLYFNEWIELKNKNKIIISPPLKNRLKIKQKGKKVIVEFDPADTLDENTTYSINFGNSIVDFTEGNPAKNIVFVFSTGDKIDSLQITGKVTGLDGKPQKDVLVMLYTTPDDSIVVKSKPYYFAITDKKGNFKIGNIKEGKYKLFALKDANNDFLYNSEKEEIAFLDTMISVKNDTVIPFYSLRLFKPEPPLRITGKEFDTKGKVKIIYNREPAKTDLLYSTVKPVYYVQNKDSLLIWIDKNPDSIKLVLQSEENTDTLLIKRKRNIKKPDTLLLTNRQKLFKFLSGDTLRLSFNQPVFMRDSSMISLADTSGNNAGFKYAIDSLKKTDFILKGEWEEGKEYKLKIFPGFITGIFGQKADTIDIQIAIDKAENYSSLKCEIDSLKKDMQYIITLKKGGKPVKKIIVTGKEKVKLTFPHLVPGNYELEVIEDSNKNGKYDSGSYFKKQKPEKIYTFVLKELKRNWQHKEQIILTQKKTDDTKDGKSGEILRQKKGGKQGLHPRPAR